MMLTGCRFVFVFFFFLFVFFVVVCLSQRKREYGTKFKDTTICNELCLIDANKTCASTMTLSFFFFCSLIIVNII